jgi:hypothetical protein
MGDYQIAASTDICTGTVHITLDMAGWMSKGFEQQNGTLPRPPAMLQEARSLVPGKGTLRDLLLKLQMTE